MEGCLSSALLCPFVITCSLSFLLITVKLDNLSLICVKVGGAQDEILQSLITSFFISPLDITTILFQLYDCMAMLIYILLISVKCF